MYPNISEDCIHLVDFLPFFKREAMFVTSCLLSYTKSLLKWGLRGKKLLPF